LHRKRQNHSKIQLAERKQTNLCIKILNLPAHRTRTKKRDRAGTPTNRTGKTVELVSKKKRKRQSREKSHCSAKGGINYHCKAVKSRQNTAQKSGKKEKINPIKKQSENTKKTQ